MEAFVPHQQVQSSAIVRENTGHLPFCFYWVGKYEEYVFSKRSLASTGWGLCPWKCELAKADGQLAWSTDDI